MILAKKQMVKVFNAWAKEYEEDPESFEDVLDENGKACTDYGENATAHFLKILGKHKDEVEKSRQ